MRIHYIMHAPFEKPGAIEHWTSAKGYKISATHTYQGEGLPAPSAFDFLILMGGPQSPLRQDKYPYLTQEIALAKQAIAANKAVLGICLGAQVIAEALGATTQKSPYKEIGVYPIQLTTEAKLDAVFSMFPQAFDVMHWHNDMPGISEGSVLLAKSVGCPRQAFRYGDRVYGLQFHLEFTPELIAEMVQQCAADLKSDTYVQSSEELLASDFTEINHKLYLLLDYLTKKVS